MYPRGGDNTLTSVSLLWEPTGLDDSATVDETETVSSLCQERANLLDRWSSRSRNLEQCLLCSHRNRRQTC